MTITATADNGVATDADFGVRVIPPGTQSELAAASERQIGAVDLSLEGESDWMHWGRTDAGSVDRKDTPVPLLSNYVPLTGGVVRTNKTSALYRWTDGAPVAATSSRQALRTVADGEQGFQLAIPADALPRTLKLYVGVKNGSGLLTLSLGGTAAPQSFVFERASGRRSFVVTVVYSSPLAGQMLDVTWQVDRVADNGWITLEAAAISGPPANAAPQITAPMEQTVVEGQPLSFGVTATDPDGPAPLGLSSTNTLPGPVSVFSETATGSGEVNWIPAVGDALGSPYSITITAVDGGGRAASANVGVTVLPDSGGENQPPQINPISGQTIIENTLLHLAINANDTDGPLPLVLSQTNTLPDPENVLLTDNGDGTGAFAWSPPTGAAGTYSVTLSAFDGEAVTDTDFQITVLPPGTGGLLVGSATIAPELVDLTLIGEQDWVHWGYDGVDDAVDRKLGVVPQISNFTALGGAEPSAGKSSMVTRYEWSDGMPQLSASTRSGLRAYDEGRGYQLRVPATAEARRLRLYVGANTVTARFTATLSDGSAPPWVFDVVQPVGKASRELTLDFATATPGAELVMTYVVIDRPVSGWASLESAALVAGNAPPVIAPLEGAAVRPDQAVNFLVQVSDPDGPLEDLLVIANANVPGAPTFVDNGDGSWLWSWTPQTEDLGDYSVSFSATDAFAGSAVSSVDFRVTLSEPPVPTPPVPQTLVAGFPLALTLTATDTDGPLPLSFAQQNTLPGEAATLTAGSAGEAFFNWNSQPGDAAGSPYVVTVTVTDGGGTSAEVGFPVAVVENVAPLLQLTPSSATALNEGQTLAVMVVASDPDATGALQVTQTNTLPGAAASFTQVEADTWEFLWTAGPGDAAPTAFDLTVTATDGLGASTFESLAVTVMPNQPPVIAAEGPLQLRSGDLFELNLQVSDLDGPLPLTITESNTFPGTPTTVSATGVFSWTPAADAHLTSPFNLTITATDGLQQPTQKVIVVEVLENLPPSIAVGGDVAREEWQQLELLVTPTDSDGSVVGVTATTTLPDAQLALTDNGDGTWGLKAAINTGAGATAQSVTLTATDNEGAETVLEVPLTITPRSQPNIVLILTDDQGLGDVAYQGFAPELTTPAIDQLAADGMRFDNFYANSSVCSPTRAALLTGRYPALVGVPGTVARDPKTNMGQFTPNGATLPELLRSAGYATALVGKWHLGDKVADTANLPNARGFDEFRGFLGSALDYYTHDGSKFAWPGDDLIMINDTVIPPAEHVGIHTTDLFTPWAVDYIEEQTTNQTQPFFLEVAYTAPHDPVQPPPAYLAAVMAREPGLDEDRAKMVALLEHMDDSIGAIVQKLKDAGVYDNTLIIYSSDNGGYTRFSANNGPYRGGKLDMYEGGIRVPAVVSWPGRIEAGSRTAEVAVTMDLYPTIAEIVNAPITQQIDGRSVVPTLRQSATTYPARDLVFENRSTLSESRWKMIYALRRANWKLVQDAPGGSFELYDLAVDPFETNDLATAEPVIFADLSAALDAHIAQSDLVPWQRDLVFEHGSVASATQSWQTVALSQPYRNPIVVATPIYDATSPPLVTRIRGITEPGVASTQFDLRVQRADGSSEAITPVAVNYMVFEAGVYNEMHHGIKLEAIPLGTRGRTNSAGRWSLAAQPTANTYENPVVVGQVLSQEDEDFSVFWARGEGRQSKPRSDYFAAGLHVGEDPDDERDAEVVGYVILETGRSLIADATLQAKVGSNDVEGIDQAPPYLYPTEGLVMPESVVLSSAGMRNLDGSWPVLYGPTPVQPGTLQLTQDEDQLGDAERASPGAQVAYVVYGNSQPEIDGLPDLASVQIGEMLSLPFTYSDLDDPGSVSVSLGSDALPTDQPMLSLNGTNSGLIAWQPLPGSEGTYTLGLQADDGRGGIVVSTITVTVLVP